jgi:hypothetical protein
MAHTKRKRRSKHRGTAAGSIEARGRTGRKPKPEELRKQEQARRRQARPPSWNSALLKAALMAAVLFALTRFGLFGEEATVFQSAVLCVAALLFYTPAAYFTDRWVYNRQLKRAGQQPPKG